MRVTKSNGKDKNSEPEDENGTPRTSQKLTLEQVQSFSTEKLLMEALRKAKERVRKVLTADFKKKNPNVVLQQPANLRIRILNRTPNNTSPNEGISDAEDVSDNGEEDGGPQMTSVSSESVLPTFEAMT